MESLYEDIMRFMEAYFPAYNQYGQIAETHRLMDKFYAPELSVDGELVTSREKWYRRCLAHPAVQDTLTVEHLLIDEKQRETDALLKTQAIDRASRKVLLELRMNVLYNIKIDQNKDLKIIKIRVFLESNPGKIARLSQLYAIES
jgi:hypothetical protein